MGSLCMENCIQLNLQGSIYVMICTIAKLHNQELPAKVQVQALASIALGSAMSLMKLAELKELFKFYSLVSKHMDIEQFANFKGNQQSFGQIKRRVWIAFAGASVVVLSLAYLAC